MHTCTVSMAQKKNNHIDILKASMLVHAQDRSESWTHHQWLLRILDKSGLACPSTMSKTPRFNISCVRLGYEGHKSHAYGDEAEHNSKNSWCRLCSRSQCVLCCFHLFL